MATVTIILRDTEEGRVKCSCDFDPPVKTGSVYTGAQQGASIMLQALGNFFEKAACDGDED